MDVARAVAGHGLALTRGTVSWPTEVRWWHSLVGVAYLSRSPRAETKRALPDAFVVHPPTFGGGDVLLPISMSAQCFNVIPSAAAAADNNHADQEGGRARGHTGHVFCAVEHLADV
jgi:hypothetical protein